MRLFRALSLAACLFTVGCPPSAPSSRDAGPPPLAAKRPADAAPDAPALDASGSLDEALPPSTSDEMTARVKHLLEAIAHDNPDLATDIVFPRDAFLATRDSADPGKAWDAKISASFKRGVHAAHQRTHGIDKAQFVSFEIGKSVQQTTPRRRDWKRPLWHVKRSRLTFTVDGKTQRVDIGEMTGWRGSWYITKMR